MISSPHPGSCEEFVSILRISHEPLNRVLLAISRALQHLNRLIRHAARRRPQQREKEICLAIRGQGLITIRMFCPVIALMPKRIGLAACHDNANFAPDGNGRVDEYRTHR